MTLTFHVSPLAAGQGLCDIDSLHHLLQKNIKKMGSLGTVELIRSRVKWEIRIIVLISPCQSIPIF